MGRPRRPERIRERVPPGRHGCPKLDLVWKTTDAEVVTEILALADGRISEDALFDWIPLHSPDVNLCVEALDQFARECRTLF